LGCMLHALLKDVFFRYNDFTETKLHPSQLGGTTVRRIYRVLTGEQRTIKL
jgi:hypothetical protein